MNGIGRRLFLTALIGGMFANGCSQPPPKPPTPPATPSVPAPSATDGQSKVENTNQEPKAEASKPVENAEPWEKLTQKEIDEITYEDAMDDYNIVYPFAPDFERVGDDENRKKSFDEWKEKLDSWDCNREENVLQRVRNFISLMALVDVMQMEFENETPLIIFERMKKEIPREQLIKASAYIALKPEVGPILDKCPDVGIDDGASEDRVRERIGVYAKKVLGRMLGKLPVKPPEEEEKK